MRIENSYLVEYVNYKFLSSLIFWLSNSFLLLRMGKLILCILKQWLVTERAKVLWKKYKAMVDDAKAKTEISAIGISCSPQEATAVLGISSIFDGA
jgi:hypothetical protein